MERIKQALELARQERNKHGQTAPLVHSVPASKNDLVANLEIEYTETRSVEVSVRESREKRIIIDQQNSVSDAYRLLRTQVLQRLKEKDWNTLAITSPANGEGKSLTAINLAISLAREVNHTVLLVDANLRSPRIQNFFDFHVEYGLSDYLFKDVPLSKILVHPEAIPRMVLLPAGYAISNSSEMLSSPKMAQLVDELKSRYASRIILFDLPPLLEGSDSLAFMPNVDAALIVVEEGQTQAPQLRQAFELLEGNEVIGTILNKAYTRDREYGNLDVKQSILSRLLTKLSQQSLPAWMSRKTNRVP